jgi:Protein of unknown function (DUF3631)
VTAEYSDTKQTFAAAESRLELAADILAGAKPAVEGDVGWVYATKTRRLPSAAVRAALPELKIVDPLIPGRDASDYGVMSLLRDADGEVVAFQLVFVDCHGAASTKGLKRQTYNLRAGGVSSGLFYAGGGEGDRAYICEGYLEKAIAVASLGIGPVYGAGSRAILGTAPPREDEVMLVTDRRPDDGTVVDPKTGMTGGALHDRDMKRAVDLLLLAGKTVAVTPDPPPCAHSCKDADDVLVKHGPIALETWFEKAELVGDLSMDGEARRIARIADPLERDVETTATAKRLKCRVGVLRERVRAHRDGEAGPAAEDDASGRAMAFNPVEAAADPQDGAQLLDDLDAAIAEHAFVDRHARTKAVLWTVHNHRRFHRNISMLPRLVISAPGEDSGKSSLGEVLLHLGDVMAYSSDPSPASVFRAIEESFCGWIFDEVDAWYGLLDLMRKIINSGSDERAKIHRVEDVGSGGKRKMEVREYSPYAPMVFVGLKLDKLLRRTTLSRALLIRMRPARVGEVKEDIIGNRLAIARLQTLSSRIKRWVADNETVLCVARPEMPAGVINRLRQIWGPLLAIADQAGGGWRKRALAALADDRGEKRDPNLGEQLLLDVRDVIAEYGVGVDGRLALHTCDIIAKLITFEERSWGIFGKSRDAIRDFEVRDLLHPFGLKTSQIQVGGRGGSNRRGYWLADLEAAVDRYVASPQPDGESAARPLDGDLSPYLGSDFSLAASPSGALPENPAARPRAEQNHEVKPRSSGLAADSLSGGGEQYNGAGNGAAAEPAPRVGDRVQWTSEGVDQLPGGAVITWLSDDGQFVRVDDSMTGIPVAQVTILRGISNGICIDCGAEVPKPARGPTAKRCPECQAKHRRPAVKPGVVFT